MNSVLAFCLGILLGVLIGAIAGIAGAIAGLRVLHLMKLKRINDKKKAEINIAYRDINFLNAKFKDAV
ncbi:MAG TPA: hypothetical protein DEF39_02100 [Hungateiclostridium thermocellum]|jgi:hypothetical protein|uniref:Uncharacterized protein n=2 Tax=Acetivibrio thermocellus TaxID=1515 RepID=A3DC85_ACET2|nr:hypothetical protein [Acetivibrio thermocellus]CDG35002.1 putative membrane protein [Acetivibrio thermocellus BC1]ABN51564.1 hypothetical protein Cthe_0326 [Acetivibrio thermocellus ATCC 27405]ADU74951.1 hypothetical protein Clo1313_1900 [Acetivibrio thermocellus DSM 1313]ALX08912.1 hypothetical protein AD2_01922 [Acetivibrio thermocellus AD2]ANV76662.1 hypothetical protein LQRI_1921 [Acetivibrio thermocellus DSM 2360]